MSGASWNQFDGGTTLGREGSEGGVIVGDEEHPLGARLTLEQDGRTAPFALTCGIYGWMVHTRFFATKREADSEYERMEDAVANLLERASDSGDEKDNILRHGCEAFVEAYP